MARGIFSVRIPDELRSEIESLAKSMNRSRGYIAEKALADYVAWNAWKSKEINAALKEADKGEFISHEAVSAWAKSLGTLNSLPTPTADVFLKPRTGEK